MKEKEKEIQIQRAVETPVQPELTRNLPTRSPATDIFESPTAITVVCDMPGVDDKNVEVTLEDDVLSLAGYPSVETPAGFELIHAGAHPAVFRRSFTLMADFDRGAIKAQVRNGVLTITLLKSKDLQPRRISVESGG